MGRFSCPDCSTTLIEKIDAYGERLWCPKCRDYLTSIVSKMAKRGR